MLPTLDGMKVMTCGIQNAYLNVGTKENNYTIAESEFGTTCSDNESAM